MKPVHTYRLLISSKTTKLLFLLILLTISACGKKGGLVYPETITPPTPAITSARYVGASIRLFIQTDNEKRNIDSVKIFRNDTALINQACSSCPDKLPLYKTIFLNNLKEIEKNGDLIAFTDNDILPESSYRYRVAAVSKERVPSAISNHVEVAVKESLKPPAISAENRPAEVYLKFAPPDLPESLTFLGFAIYRREIGQDFPAFPLKALVTDRDDSDFSAKNGKKYIYAARCVVKDKSGEIFESFLSKEVEAWRQDYE